MAPLTAARGWCHGSESEPSSSAIRRRTMPSQACGETGSPRVGRCSSSSVQRQRGAVIEASSTASTCSAVSAASSAGSQSPRIAAGSRSVRASR